VPSSSLTAEVLIVRVPLENTDSEGMARLRATVYGQFACGMTMPEVEAIQRLDAFWRVKLREGALGEAR